MQEELLACVNPERSILSTQQKGTACKTAWQEGCVVLLGQLCHHCKRKCHISQRVVAAQSRVQSSLSHSSSGAAAFPRSLDRIRTCRAAGQGLVWPRLSLSSRDEPRMCDDDAETAFH